MESNVKGRGFAVDSHGARLLRASFPLVSASIFLFVEPEPQLLFCYADQAFWKSWR